jgi:transposase InsO family protein
VRVYRFIDSQRTSFPTKALCRVCEVAPSSFYAWVAAQAAGPDEATLAEAYLANRIHDIWTGSRRRYGVPRVTAQLWREGVRINRKRVARLMCLVGIQGTCGRRKVVTTRRDPTATPAPDLVQRQFEQLCLDQLYVGDITYIPTDEGFCYLAGVLDACSRRMVGWSIAAHMRSELVADALRMAALTRGTTASTAWCSTPIMAASTQALSTATSAPNSASRNRWARPGTATTMPWRNQPGPH